ncbi:MAG: hypothetical protein HC896_04545 [Bacteroidales bacterium]|nr:hypothetical protein [Bacteroidales bacterium]
MDLLKKMKGTFIIILLGLLLQACEKHNYAPVGPDLSTPVLFSVSVQPIFNNVCNECHAKGAKPNLSEGNAFESLESGGYIVSDTSKTKESRFYQKIYVKEHKLDKLSLEDQNTIKAWLYQGAQNN